MSDTPFQTPMERAPERARQGQQQPDFPFRFGLLEAGTEEIERQNREQGFKGARKLKPTPEAIEMASSAKTAVPKRLRSWLRHPDERVVQALLQNENTPWRTRKDQDLIAQCLVGQGQKSGEKHENLWNPLLDWALSPAPGDRSYGNFWNKWVDHCPSPDGFLEQVGQWVSQQTNPNRIQPLLAYQSPEFLQTVARHLSCWDEGLITELLTRDCAVALAENRYLGHPAKTFLIEASLGELQAQQQRHHNKENIHGDFQPAAVLRTLIHRHNKDHREAVKFNRVPFRDRHVQALLDIAHNQKEDGQKGYWHPGGQAARLLIGIENEELIDEDMLLEVYPRIRDEQRKVISLLRHPLATVRLWKQVLKDSSLFPVRKFITKDMEDTYHGQQNPNWSQRHKKLQEAVLQDPECQEVLRSSQSLDVRIRLFQQEGGSPDEFYELVQKAMDKNPHRTAELLAEASPEHLEPLTREDLLPLLTHEDQQVRQLAMRASQRMQNRQQDPPQTTSR